MSFFLHPTAILETGVQIGDACSIWDNVHIRRNTRLGKHCIVGEKTYIAYDVSIGDFAKINAFVYICTGVTIEDGVMISAGCIFTNDKYPRATNSEITVLQGSNPGIDALETIVRSGATLGARSVIGPGITIGRFAMVGMGAVVTGPVADFHLVVGCPARTIGYVCRCGHPVVRFSPECEPVNLSALCTSCGRKYQAVSGTVLEVTAEELSRITH